MKRVLQLTAISAALGVALVACSEHPSDSAPQTPAASRAAEPAPAAAGGEAQGTEATGGAGDQGQEPAAAEAMPDEGVVAAPGESQADLDCDAPDVTCPLFDWMTENMKPAVEDRDLVALAKGLHRIELLTPDPDWSRGDDAWPRIARRGAVAAEAGNFREARRACKGCHKLLPEEGRSYRDMFREHRRLGSLPDLPANADEGLPGLDMGAGR